MNNLQQLRLELQASKGTALELGFIQKALHVVNTVKKHAPKLIAAAKRTTFGSTANRMRKAAPVASSYFDKATSMGRAAFNTAKKGASFVHAQTFAKDKPMQSFRRGGPNLLKTAYRNKGKIAVGIGAGGAIAGGAMQSQVRPQQDIEQKPKPVRFQVQPSSLKEGGGSAVQQVSKRPSQMKKSQLAPKQLFGDDPGTHPEHLPHHIQEGGGVPQMEIQRQIHPAGADPLKRRNDNSVT